MASIDTIFLVGKIIQEPDFIKIIFDVLNDSWRSVLYQVVHRVERFYDPLPLLRLAVNLSPEMLHDHIIVFPIVGVVRQNL